MSTAIALSDPRDVPLGGLVDERLRRRPERQALGDPDEPLHLADEVERRPIRRDEVVDERDRDLARLDADTFLAELEDRVVAAVFPRRARLAVADVHAGQVLQLQRDVLGDMAHPCAVAEARDKAAAAAQ